MTRIGLILSGCGVFDGSEIHESVAAMLAICRAGAEYKCMAPDIQQMHVVNHFSGEASETEHRNVLIESSRIARGDIVDLRKVRIDEFDGFMFPGGFGAAKNLCDFAVAGSNCEVNPQVAEFIHKAREAGKPMAFVCISPVILARLFGGEGVKLTIGDDAEAGTAVTAMGAQHIACQVKELVIDEERRLITSPAYMKAENIADLFDDVTASVNALMELISRSTQTETA